MIRICMWMLLALSFWGEAAVAAKPGPAQTAYETTRIEALITGVEKAHGLVFIRNGSEHDGAAAAAHLRMKWKQAGSRVRTAEDFIKVCASKSSLSGRAYQIRSADGHLLDSADYFNAQLRRIDAASRARPVRASASTPG